MSTTVTAADAYTTAREDYRAALNRAAAAQPHERDAAMAQVEAAAAVFKATCTLLGLR